MGPADSSWTHHALAISRPEPFTGNTREQQGDGGRHRHELGCQKADRNGAGSQCAVMRENLRAVMNRNGTSSQRARLLRRFTRLVLRGCFPGVKDARPTAA